MAATLILGHRGASREAPENTPAAFRRALELGADGVELDVRRTIDGALVCHHGLQAGDALIQDTTLEAVRAASPDTPLLAEALDAATGAALVLAEAKMPDGDRDLLLPSISDTLGEFAAARTGGPPLVIASKQVHVLREIHEIAPAQPLAAILGRPLGAGEWRWFLGLPLRVVALRGDLCTPDRVADVMAAGHDWYAWTINDRDEARRLRDAGAAALVTDDPLGIAGALRA